MAPGNLSLYQQDIDEEDLDEEDLETNNDDAGNILSNILAI